MKKIYILLLMALITLGGFAQINSKLPTGLRRPTSIPSAHNLSRSGSNQIWLDYDSADDYINNQSNLYFIWPMNKRYSLATHDTNTWQRCIVRFDSLFDMYTLSSIDTNTFQNMVVDSIYAYLGHLNTSATNDTLIARIIDSKEMYYPNSTTLWTDTMVTDTSWSTSGYLNMSPQYFKWNPGKNLGAGVKGFAVELDYYGNKADTCVFWAGGHGTVINDTGNCIVVDQLSGFYPNSYASWTQFVATHPLIPDSTGFDIWYNNNCGFDSVYRPGDGNNPIQDILIGAWVTVTTQTGIKEATQQAPQINIYPNPASNKLFIQSNVTLGNAIAVLSNVLGQEISSPVSLQSKGKDAEIDVSQLAAGMYFLQFKTESGSVVKKFVKE